VTALPLAPLIPSSSVPADRRRARAAAGRPLPLARPMRSVPQDVVYGVARIDASGRICERAIIAVLGWVGGDRLTSTANSGVVIARRDAGGMVTLPASGYITIPAALRRRCGLEPGDQVLLAAVPAADMLTAYSFAVVDEAIRAHGSFPNAQGEKP
jgi:AbrB family looped-hinge helix DNA binding protein